MTLFALAVSAYVACTNCSATGWVSVPCSKCDGKGVVSVVRIRNHVRGPVDVACSSCSKGFAKEGSKGTGVQRRTCPVCKGQKKVKKNSTTR